MSTPQDFRAGGARRGNMPIRDRQSIWVAPLIKATGLRTVKLLLGDGAAEATSDGGWSFVSRPRTTGFTTWDGRMPYVMTIPVMLDGLANNASVEGEWEALRSIHRNSVGPEKQPSPVSLTGAVPLSNLIWVIQSIVPTLELRRPVDTHRVRIVATLTVMQFVEADVIMANKASPAKAAAARKPATSQPRDASKMSKAEVARLLKAGWKNSPTDGKERLYPPDWVKQKDGSYLAPKTAAKPAASRSYVVKSGDTLSKIAQALLGAYKRWPEIAKLNGIRDPKAVKVGQRLKIPA